MRFETELFGDLKEHPVWSNEENLQVGDHISLVNSSCEFEYDNITGTFHSHGGYELMYCYICELELLETDLSEYIPSKSNNGGAYAFAECRVKKILEKTY